RFAFSKVYLNKDQALKIAFPKTSSVKKKVVWFEEADIPKIEKLARQKLRLKRIALYIGKKNDKITGYAIIDNVIGKKEYITYMLVINPKGRIQRVEILAYRESQGSEITNKGWRGQFKEKDIQDPIRLRQDITNISGATLSCRAITKGVRKLLAIFEVSIKNKNLD
ncbi:MAG TPA: FMN-binding protein, partial [Spirochaetes bacterium]|nr:FMN-binding protein [Spirochaetota bacterium]